MGRSASQPKPHSAGHRQQQRPKAESHCQIPSKALKKTLQARLYLPRCWVVDKFVHDARAKSQGAQAFSVCGAKAGPGRQDELEAVRPRGASDSQIPSPGPPRPHKEPQPHFFKSRSRQADKASCTRAFQKAQTSTCSSIPLYPIIPCHPATGKLKGRSVHAALDLPQAEQPSICESSQLPPCHSATGVAFVWLRYGCSLKPLLPLVTERSIVLGISAAHLKVSGTKIVVQHSMMMQ